MKQLKKAPCLLLLMIRHLDYCEPSTTEGLGDLIIIYFICGYLEFSQMRLGSLNPPEVLSGQSTP